MATTTYNLLVWPYTPDKPTEHEIKQYRKDQDKLERQSEIYFFENSSGDIR